MGVAQPPQRNNLTTGVYEQNNENRFQRASDSSSFTYDPNGNTACFVEVITAGSNTWVYEYNQENRLEKVMEFPMFKTFTNEIISAAFYGVNRISKNLTLMLIFSLFALVLESCLPYSNKTNGQILFLSERERELAALYLININDKEVTSLLPGFAPYYGPSWSSDGYKILYASDKVEDKRLIDELYYFDIVDSEPTIIIDAVDFIISDPAWSPDSTKIVFVSNADYSLNPDFFVPYPDIFVMDSDGSNLVNLTNQLGIDINPVWSPDGSKIAFMSDRNGNHEIFIMNADGTSPTNITRNPAQDSQPSWSPDGTKILFTSNRDDPSAHDPTPTPRIFAGSPKKINLEIYVMDINGSNQVNLSNHPSNDSQAVWSPDGRKIAFVSDRDFNEEIYIMNLDGSDQVNITNHLGNDFSPAWRP